MKTIQSNNARAFDGAGKGFGLDKSAEVKTFTVKTIDVNALEWFDKVNGNSYFAASVTVNYGMDDARTIYLPFQYGYGDAYLQEAFSELKKQNLLPHVGGTQSLSQYCRVEDIILRTTKHENCKKAELKNLGK